MRESGLAQYYVSERFDTCRMFYVKHNIPLYLLKALVIMAINENTKNDLRQNMIKRGLARSSLFSWQRHVEQLLEFAGKQNNQEGN